MLQPCAETHALGHAHEAGGIGPALRDGHGVAQLGLGTRALELANQAEKSLQQRIGSFRPWRRLGSGSWLGVHPTSLSGPVAVSDRTPSLLVELYRKHNNFWLMI
jgi:hypothetical protein